MTTTASTAVVVYDPGLVDPEHVALAGFRGGYRGLTRDAYVLDLRQFVAFCDRRHLSLFEVRRSDIETFGRELEAKGRATATIGRRLCTVTGRCATSKRPHRTPIRAPPCVTTGPACRSIVTPPTSCPPTSPAPPADRRSGRQQESAGAQSWRPPSRNNADSALPAFAGRSDQGGAKLNVRHRADGLRVQPVALDWEQTNIDARDPLALGRWWREALGWVVVDEGPDVFEIRPEETRTPGLLFVPVQDRKTVKNRLHLDFRPDDRDREVERLLSIGATRVDIGQGEQSWVVLADPEGNEFCVLASRQED